MKRWIWTGSLALALPIMAGPYSAGLNDSGNVNDAPVPGFIGPHGPGKARLTDGNGGVQNPDNRVNPLFFAWASAFTNYQRSDTDAGFNDPSYALGPVTGDNFDIVSLGDLTSAEINAGNSSGTVTLEFTKPIRDLSGSDFVIFENGFSSSFNSGGAGIGGVSAELAYVEVSADGVNFQRFDSVSLTPSSVGSYGSINPTNTYNLAGKHVNAYGNSWGTPFDLAQTGLSTISHIRLIDIPGNGTFKDKNGNSIYDAWRTFGSGGFDLEAIGSISTRLTYAEWPLLSELPSGERNEEDDPDGDGMTNLLEYALGLVPSVPDSPALGWRHIWVQEGSQSFSEVLCLRDERPIDLVRSIESSEDLKNWTTIARSISSSPFVAQNGYQVQITDTRAGSLASVGIIREDRVRDLSPTPATGKRFYRLKVVRIDP